MIWCKGLMKAESMWAAFGFLVKFMFTWTASSINRTVAYGETETSMLQSHPPCIQKMLWFGPPFLPKGSLLQFSDLKWLLHQAVWTFFVNLWKYKILEATVKTSWLMQDGARTRRTADIFNFHNEQFDDRMIVLDYPTHKRKFHGMASLFARHEPL